jgi:WD40 repeat protein
LLIGVDSYDDHQIWPLIGAANDARAVKSALTNYAGFRNDQIVVLASGEPSERLPTRTNIIARLSNLLKIVPKDGLLVVGFSGHGIERQSRAFLLASNSAFNDDPRVLEQTAVSVEVIRTWIREAGIGQVILFIDACRNDPGGRGDAPNRLTQAFSDAFKFELRNDGIVAFATLYATRVGDRAYEYLEERRGYFSWALEQALAGKAANDRGEVTLGAVVRYLEDQVPRLTALDLGPSKVQTPRSEVGGYRASALVLSVIKESAGCSEAAREAWTLVRDSTNRALLESFVSDFPRCEYASLARLRLRAAEQKPEQPTPPPVPAESQSLKALPRLVVPGGLRGAVFHPNGRWAVVAGSDASLTAWDLASGKLLRQFEGRCGRITAAKVLFLGECHLSTLRDGAKVISASSGTVQIWDFQSGKLDKVLHGPEGSTYFQVVVAPDNKTLFVASSKACFDVWDWTEAKLIRSIPGHSFDIDITLDGKWLVTGGYNHAATVWNAATFQPAWTSKEKTEFIDSVRFSPSGKLVAAVSRTGKVEIHDMEKGTSRILDTSLGAWSYLQFSEDEKQLLVSGRDQKRETIFYNLETSQRERTAEFVPMSWSVDGRHAVGPSKDGFILLDGRTGEELRRIVCCRELITRIQFLGADDIVTSSYNRYVQRWNWHVGKPQLIASRVALFSLAHQTELAVAGGDEGAVKLQLLRRTADKWEKIADLGDAGGGTVKAIDVSTDGNWALSGQNPANLWDLENRKLAKTYDIGDAKFSADGHFLIGSVLYPHHEVRIVRRDTGEIYRTMRGHTSYIEDVAYAPNGEFAVSGSRDETVRIWDVKTGLERQTLQGHNDWVTVVAISPDNGLILSGGDDSTVRVWDANTGKQLHVLQHETPIATIVFTPDGKHVATGSWDGVRLWDPRTGREITAPPVEQ